MPKLTKVQLRDNNLINDLVYSDKPLTQDERFFILEHYTPTPKIVTAINAFFTPIGLAHEAYLYMNDWGVIVDIGAGIGRLTYYQLMKRPKEVIAVELEPDFVRIGKRVCPEATWINSDIFL